MLTFFAFFQAVVLVLATQQQTAGYSILNSNAEECENGEWKESGQDLNIYSLNFASPASDCIIPARFKHHASIGIVMNHGPNPDTPPPDTI